MCGQKHQVVKLKDQLKRLGKQKLGLKLYTMNDLTISVWHSTCLLHLTSVFTAAANFAQM